LSCRSLGCIAIANARAQRTGCGYCLSEHGVRLYPDMNCPGALARETKCSHEEGLLAENCSDQHARFYWRYSCLAKARAQEA
jgi:hypothetical protein